MFKNSTESTSKPVMADSFTFESKYLGTTTKLFRIRSSDETEWTMFDRWLTTQTKSKLVLQRLTFRKENSYDIRYRIDLRIKAACGNVKGTIKLSKEETNSAFTKFRIPLDQFREIKVKRILKCPCKNCSYNRHTIYGQEFSDIFRYDVTITRLEEPPDKSKSIPQREIILSLSDQMTSMLETGHFADFVIDCCNTRINVHKNILSVRVPYFQRMLSSGMAEARLNYVRFKDIKIKVLQEMLHYIYSGVLKPVPLRMVHDLFELSDKFEMDDLKTLCSEIIQNHISCHNAASVLRLADKYHENSLKNSCVEFIALNFYKVKHFDGEFAKLGDSLLSLIEIRKNNLNQLTNPEN